MSLPITNRMHRTRYVLNRRVFTINRMVIASHPPYSSVLAPCDFFLFPKIKNECQPSKKEIQGKKTQEALDMMTKDEKCWDKCITSQGEYFEGD